MHKIRLQQIRTTQQPAHQLFDLFVLLAILHTSKTEQYGAAKHLLLMGRSLLTGDVLVMVRFRHRRGPFWSSAAWLAQLWAVLAMGRFGIDPQLTVHATEVTLYISNSLKLSKW